MTDRAARGGRVSTSRATARSANTARGRERFLRAIAERVPVERIEEVHLFPPIRQGAHESGVAVIALRPAAPSRDEHPSSTEPGLSKREDDVIIVAPDARARDVIPDDPHDDPPDDSWLDTDAPLVRGERPASDAPERDEPERDEPTPPGARRFDVWIAAYVLTLKGPERGAWEMDVTDEAVAPADTIDAVVRGVHRRAGGLDEPERLSADAFRAALAEESWSAAR